MSDPNGVALDEAAIASNDVASLAERIHQLETELAASLSENARLARGVAPTAPAPAIDGPTVTCPGCGDVSTAPDGDEHFLTKTISRCSKCGVRIVYGELAPRPVVEPASFSTVFGPRPAIMLRFQDPVTKADVYAAKLDPEAAFLVGQAIISLVRP